MIPASDRTRWLFAGSCAAVTALAFSFAALSAIMFQLKSEFLLDNAQVGLIGGASLWGMAISQVGFSSLCDVLGMRKLLMLAFVGHVAGIGFFLFAGGFGALFGAALVIAIANGMIEAVCNPLVAALYPDRKAAMLNRLHLWFPGGIVLGGLTMWGLDLAGWGWRPKMLIVLAPALVYALVLFRARFPATETAQHGATFGDAIRAVLTMPLLWLFLALMAVTMSLELGPNRWIPAVLEAGGMPGILVLVMINGVMAVARYNAHSLLGRVSPPVLLMLCTAVAGAGLLLLSFASGISQTVGAAFIFAIGISVVWPTMMGFVAERVPSTGALGLGLMAAAGSLAVGVVTTPLLGAIADSHLPAAMPAGNVAALAEGVVEAPASPELRAAAARVLASPGSADATGELLRRVAAGEAGPALAAEAAPLLHEGENRSGLLSFRYLAPFAALVCLVFGIIALIDRRRGGYAAQVDRAKLQRTSNA